MKDDRVYVEHILECIRRIERYTQDGKTAFLADSLIADAVIRNLQVLAESSQRISAEAKARWPLVAWREMSGFRNVLVHDYLGLDLDQTWDVVELDLPALKGWMEKISSEMG